MNSSAARLWFSDLWNYSIVPYMMEALRDNTQVGLVMTCVAYIFIHSLSSLAYVCASQSRTYNDIERCPNSVTP